MTCVELLTVTASGLHVYVQRYQKIQRERLVSEFMKVLNTFQAVQRMEKEMEKSKTTPSSQPQSTTSYVR